MLWGKNIETECLSTKCWVEHLDESEVKQKKEWGKLNDEAFHSGYTSPDIIMLIRLRRAGQVARMLQMRIQLRLGRKTASDASTLGDWDLDGAVIKCVLEMWGVIM